MACDSAQFNAAMFRRIPDFDRELAKDRFPISVVYSNFYKSITWPSGTGVEHTWDRVHVTMPNDDGCWSAKVIDPCLGAPCDPAAKYLGNGSTRSTYVKYGRVYRTPVWCFDQIRDYEMFKEQMAAIIEGYKPLPDQITSNFLRKLALRQSDVLWIAGSADKTITTTAAMFNANCTRIDLGGVGNLPTSKVTMNYLDNHVDDLTYKGYFNRQFLESGSDTFMMTTDIQSRRDLSNSNPTLRPMYTGADFAKGGKLYQYGLSMVVGNWGFKNDTEQLRFQHVGGGVLEQIVPYQNVPTTIGKMPQFDPAYKNARYAAYHVYNQAARQVQVGDITPVNPEMKFNTSRSLMGKWQWYSPDGMFQAADPCTGAVCTYENHKQNKGFFEAEWELSMKSTYPEIEMWILAQREPQPVIDVPACATEPYQVYQYDLYPYNCGCVTT